ncbi:hypothetical protein NMD70_08455 [Edwardsiella tarda]|uniref:HNH endonuclease n=1 Tax=Edwardsiella tarda TaxID=636 RepID=UPI00351C68B0
MATDPLEPKLNTFSFSEEEENAIRFALSKEKPWNHDDNELSSVKEIIKRIKVRIRDFHMERQLNQCCYCRTVLHGTGAFMIDREHILPKGKYKNLTYNISNLSIACKRCNMEIKKDSLGFIQHPDSVEANFDDVSQYRFIHPNYEKYSDFITRIQFQCGDVCVVKYFFDDSCEKSKFTYNYFKLENLEINSIDETQGIISTDSEIILMLRLHEKIDV